MDPGIAAAKAARRAKTLRDRRARERASASNPAPGTRPPLPLSPKEQLIRSQPNSAAARHHHQHAREHCQSQHGAQPTGESSGAQDINTLAGLPLDELDVDGDVPMAITPRELASHNGGISN
jgi:hypothetical protein